MNPPFRHVTIIGVGLLGSSLGLALKARGLAQRVTGVGRRQSSLDTALRRGAIDSAVLDALSCAADADLVVIATPAALVSPMIERLRQETSATMVITDVASTKAAICAHASAMLPLPRRFIGSHPMAGSEQFGPEHGQPDLYEDSVCLVEEGPDLDEPAHGRVVALWEGVGARVVPVNPVSHDAVLARTSHLPHVLAAAIAELASRSGDIRPLIGNGFRDMTRIAAGRPEVWRDICLTNRTALLDSLQEIQGSLEGFTQALKAEDGTALEAFFAEARDARAKTVGP